MRIGKDLREDWFIKNFKQKLNFFNKNILLAGRTSRLYFLGFSKVFMRSSSIRHKSLSVEFFASEKASNKTDIKFIFSDSDDAHKSMQLGLLPWEIERRQNVLHSSKLSNLFKPGFFK